MRTEIAIISALTLVLSVPLAFAEVGKNYDTVTNDDGSITWTSHPERILVDNEWQNYFLEVNDSKVIFNSNSVGSFIFDKDSCSYTIYENGWASPDTQIIPSVSAVATYFKDGTWQNMEVNNLSCEVTVEEFEDRVILKSVKEDVTKYEQEIILDIKDGFKETFRVTHNGSEQLGISQTIHTGESITIGGQTINIAELNGQSFDKQFIVDNRAEILQVADNLNYDFDVGIDSLSAIHIIHDSDYKVNMDFSDGSFVNFLEIDPTFTSSGTRVGHIGVANTASSCSTSGGGSFGGSEIGYYSTSFNFGCYVLGFYWDISSISDSATISDVSLEYDVGGVSSGRNCSFNSIEGTLSSDGYSTAYPDIFGSDGTTTSYVSNDANCKTANSTQTVDLGTNADSDFQNDLSTDEFGIGIVYTDSSRDGTNHTTGIPTAEITVTYSVPAKPDAITDLAGSFNNPNVDLTFSTPSDNGSTITSFKVYRDSGSGYSLIDTVSSSSLTSYQDTNPISGVNNNYKVNAVNAIAEADDSNVATVFVGTPPDEPTGVSTSISDVDTAPLDITVSWSAPTNVGSGTLTGFEIYRDSVLITTTGLVTTYTDTVPNSGTFEYKLKSVSTHGTSGFSNTSNITTPSVPSSPLNASSVISNINSAPYDVTVSWDLPTSSGGSALTGYNVYRQTGTGAFSLITTTTALGYVDTVPSVPNQDYTWKIHAVNNVGESTAFTTTTITTGNVPDAPVLSFTTGTTALSWTVPNSDASITGYEVFRDSVSLVNVTTTSHSDFTPINSGQSYQYEVQAVSSLGNSANSNSIVTTPEIEITGMIVQGITGTGAVIDWEEPAYYQGQITSYSVYYATPATSADPTISAGTTTNTYSNFAPTLDYDTSYTFGVIVNSPLGTSGFSNLVNATTNADTSIVSADPTTGGMTWFDIDSINEQTFNVIEFQRETQNLNVNGTLTDVDTLQIGYPSWWDDMTCNVDYKFAQKTEQYVEGTDMTATVNSADANQQIIAFQFHDIDNEVIEIECAPQQSTQDDGVSAKFIMTQNNLSTGMPNIPLVTQIQAFQTGEYGTDGEFGALDIVGLFVILLSMVGFNRLSPIVGVLLSASLVFALAFFGIISIPTILVGVIALVIFLAWGITRNR